VAHPPSGLLHRLGELTEQQTCRSCSSVPSSAAGNSAQLWRPESSFGSRPPAGRAASRKRLFSKVEHPGEGAAGAVRLVGGITSARTGAVNCQDPVRNCLGSQTVRLWVRKHRPQEETASSLPRKPGFQAWPSRRFSRFEDVAVAVLVLATKARRNRNSGTKGVVGMGLGGAVDQDCNAQCRSCSTGKTL